jgi:hypothetical protein
MPGVCHDLFFLELSENIHEWGSVAPVSRNSSPRLLGNQQNQTARLANHPSVARDFSAKRYSEPRRYKLTAFISPTHIVDDARWFAQHSRRIHRSDTSRERASLAKEGVARIRIGIHDGPVLRSMRATPSFISAFCVGFMSTWSEVE